MYDGLQNYSKKKMCCHSNVSPRHHDLCTRMFFSFDFFVNTSLCVCVLYPRGPAACCSHSLYICVCVVIIFMSNYYKVYTTCSDVARAEMR